MGNLGDAEHFAINSDHGADGNATPVVSEPDIYWTAPIEDNGFNDIDGPGAPIANPFQPTTVPAAAPIQPVVSGLTPPHDHGQDIVTPGPLNLPEPVLQHHDPDTEPALSPFSASIPAAHTQAMIDAADKDAREVANKILEALKYGIDQGNGIVLKFGGHFVRISKALAMQL